MERFFKIISTDSFYELQAFTNPGTLETFKRGEAKNTDQVLKSENRWCHNAHSCMITAKAAWGAATPKSTVLCASGRCKLSPGPGGHRWAPGTNQVLALRLPLFSLGSRFPASIIRSPHSTRTRELLAPSVYLAPAFVCPSTPCQPELSAVTTAFLPQSGRKTPDSPFLALGEAGPAQSF